MKICIDIDGTMTVRDYYIPFFNCFFHKNIKFTQMVEYDLQKVYGVSEEQIIDFYQKCGRTMHASAGIQENVVKTLFFSILKKSTSYESFCDEIQNSGHKLTINDNDIVIDEINLTKQKIIN